MMEIRFAPGTVLKWVPTEELVREGHIEDICRLVRENIEKSFRLGRWECLATPSDFTPAAKKVRLAEAMMDIRTGVREILERDKPPGRHACRMKSTA